MARSEEKAFQNECVFREANEKIAERAAELAPVDGLTPVLCECEEEACTELVRISLEDYRQIRADPLTFVIVPGHETRGKETSRSGDGWVCVRKVQPATNDRERRLGENEILFREVNERVRELQESFGLDDEHVLFVCECAQVDCKDRISMSVAEYEQVRADPARFIVKPGHQVAEVESVVEVHDTYLVIRKHEGGPAELAASEDPRG